MSLTAVDDAAVVAPRLRANPWLALLTLTLGYFMIMLDNTIVNIAIPNVERGLNITFDQILWVVNAYLLVYAVLLIVVGRVGDIFGPRRLLLLGIAVFTLASAACGLSQSANQLIGFRAIQGVGGALITPQTLTLIPTIFPPERRGGAYAAWSAVSGISLVAGPILGGVLVTAYSWPAIFFINLPIGVVAIVGAYLVLPEVRSHTRRGLDLTGMLLIGASLLCGVCALIEGQRYDWGPITELGSFSLVNMRWSIISIYSLLAYATLLLLFFLRHEARAEDPLVPLALFHDRNFSGGVAGLFVVMFALFGVSLPFSIFLQSVLGFSAVKAGLTFLPLAAAMLLMAVVSGRLSDQGKGRLLLSLGFVVFGSGLALLIVTFSLDNTAWSYVPALVLIGAGMGAQFSPLLTLTMRDVPPRMVSTASGVFNTVRQVSGVMGTALVGAVLANVVAAALPRQARHVAQQVPAPFRSHFLAVWQAGSHGAQRFGTGQTAPASLGRGVPLALAERIAALSHQVFGQAFLDGLRPALLLPLVGVAVGLLAVTWMRDARVAPGPEEAEPGRTEARV
jgi:EmrB/QacA subfamily drug resistance transporter